jgi:hypothetical protein
MNKEIIGFLFSSSNPTANDQPMVSHFNKRDLKKALSIQVKRDSMTYSRIREIKAVALQGIDALDNF